MLLTNSQPPSPSSSSTHERVQLLYGIENIAKVQSQVVYNAKARIDVCVDSKSPSIAIEGEHVKNILLDAITTNILPRMKSISENFESFSNLDIDCFVRKPTSIDELVKIVKTKLNS